MYPFFNQFFSGFPYFMSRPVQQGPNNMPGQPDNTTFRRMPYDPNSPVQKDQESNAPKFGGQPDNTTFRRMPYDPYSPIQTLEELIAPKFGGQPDNRTFRPMPYDPNSPVQPDNTTQRPFMPKRPRPISEGAMSKAEDRFGEYGFDKNVMDFLAQNIQKGYMDQGMNITYDPTNQMFAVGSLGMKQGPATNYSLEDFTNKFVSPSGTSNNTPIEGMPTSGGIESLIPRDPGYGGGFNSFMGGGFNPYFSGYGRGNSFMGGGFNPYFSGYGGGNPFMSGYGGGNPYFSGYGGGNPFMSGIGGLFG